MPTNTTTFATMPDAALAEREAALVAEAHGLADDAGSVDRLSAIADELDELREVAAQRLGTTADDETDEVATLRERIGAPAEEPEPIAAAATPRPLHERTVPASHRPRAEDRSPVVRVSGGGELDSPEAIGRYLSDWDANARMANAGANVARLTFARGEVAEARRLSPGDPAENGRKIAEVQAIVAAGGVCTPVSPYYEQFSGADASRPVRDALPSFDAARGGISFVAPPLLSTIGTSGGSPSQAIDVITNTEDAADATKAYQAFSCGSPTEVKIQSITNRARHGNLPMRTHPERFVALTQAAMAAHARVAELELLTAIEAGSTVVTTGQEISALRDFVRHIVKARSDVIGRQRLPIATPFRVLLPYWLGNLFIADQAVAAHGLGFDVTHEAIAALLARNGLNVTWAMESTASGSSVGVPAAQSTGAINAWPGTVDVPLFHEGAWLFLDGGDLDLGMVRDSTLNATNQFETFSETFEGAAFVGVESTVLRMSLCPAGEAMGYAPDNEICDSGS